MRGAIRLEDVAGGVVAGTMSGEIQANIRELREGKPLSFTSMNGEVTLRLPEQAKANVRLRTQNGAVLTDFDDTALVTKTETSGAFHGKSAFIYKGMPNGKVISAEVEDALREAARISATATQQALQAVKEGLETAMQQLKWRSDAKKVIILVASSPPHKDDLASIDKLVATWRARGGVISGIDVSLRLHEEHERKLNRWLYGEEPREVSPLPDFYKEVNQSLSAIATPTGGAVLSLGQDAALVRHLLVLTFGPQWEKDLGRVVRGM